MGGKRVVPFEIPGLFDGWEKEGEKHDFHGIGSPPTPTDHNQLDLSSSNSNFVERLGWYDKGFGVLEGL